MKRLPAGLPPGDPRVALALVSSPSPRRPPLMSPTDFCLPAYGSPEWFRWQRIFDNLLPYIEGQHPCPCFIHNSRSQ